MNTAALRSHMMLHLERRACGPYVASDRTCTFTCMVRGAWCVVRGAWRVVRGAWCMADLCHASIAGAGLCEWLRTSCERAANELRTS